MEMIEPFAVIIEKSIIIVVAQGIMLLVYDHVHPLPKR